MEETQPLIDRRKQTGKIALTKCGLFVVILACLIIGVGVGVVISMFVFPDSKEEITIRKHAAEADSNIQAMLQQEIIASNIKSYLRDLTARPHLAGTPADRRQAEELAQFWETNAIESVVVPYNALLSYPDPNNPNRIQLQDGDGKPIYTTQLAEKPLRPEESDPDVVPPFSAYSSPGNPKGDLIYVNYGRIEDFIWLSETKGIDFTDKICIARYGQIFRGDKARFAERYGAAGLIFYSDPADYTRDNYDGVYPYSVNLPGTGVQRGNLKGSRVLGDPLTPGYPAAQNAEAYGCIGLIVFSDPADYAPLGWDVVYPDSVMLPGTGVQRGSYFLDDSRTPGYPDIESAFPVDEEDLALPRIPIHPIGYDDAYHLLKDLAGEDAPEDWQGNLNFTYKIGPGFADPNSKVQMFISTHNENATIYDAIGFIEGCTEPDRYVVMGNHRDAWVFGAVDPSSGTAVMKEITRAMGKLVQQGWCPRRTIIFCSWGAEEYGLIGSREWIEQFGQILGDRTISYLNLDTAVTGDFTFAASSMPLLTNLIYDAAKTVPNPHDGGKTSLYDDWLNKTPATQDDGKETGVPLVGILGSGSDYEAFVGKVGITSASFSYDFDPSLGLSSDPAYHSLHDTFYYFSTFIDPEFKFSRSMGQLVGEMIRRLADDYVIPFHVEDFGVAIDGYVRQVLGEYEATMRENGLGFRIDYLTEAVAKFKQATNQFETYKKSMSKDDPFEVRRINDRMMLLDRKFIDPIGLPARPLARNVVFAPSDHDSYSGSKFPGLVDAMFQIDKLIGTERDERWKEVAKQLSVLTFFIQNAAASLQSPTDFH